MSSPGRSTAQKLAGSPSAPAFAGVARQHRTGLDVVRSEGGMGCDWDLTLTPLAGESLEGMARRLECVLQEFGATPVLQFVFGSPESLKGGEGVFRGVFGEVGWPVTWVHGTGAIGGGLAGFQVMAVSGREVARVRRNGRVVGSVFSDGVARHFVLGGLGYDRAGLSRTEQTRLALVDLEELLTGQGFSMSQVVRTWFYLDDILAWYGDFNRVRTAVYCRHRFCVGALPASTGVRGSNPWGSALALAAWVSQAIGGEEFPAREVVSPLQRPASEYGSSFSRAVEVGLPRRCRAYVSGTASIEPGGKTVWVGDIGRQIELSMEVVEAILKSRGMSFADTSRATLYFKKPEYVAAFQEWSAGHCALPGVAVHCDICREDLLFEIELDAVKAR